MYNNSIPTVSILLPIFNASRYLRESLDSLLAQSFRDFEIIAIDDGSVDDSYRIVASYRDTRLRLHRQENQGLASTLNRAFSLARGRYIARQDADDIALPERLKKQVDFLDQNSDIFLLGTAAEIWEEHIRSPRQHNHPTDPAELAFAMLFDNFFVHSSVMVRREVFDTVGLYATTNDRQPEDYELWSRIIRCFRCGNLPDVLQVYRECKGSICRSSPHPFRGRVANLSAENIAHATGRSTPSIAHKQIANLTHQVPLDQPCLPYQTLADELQRAASSICEVTGYSRAHLSKALEGRLGALRQNIRALSHSKRRILRSAARKISQLIPRVANAVAFSTRRHGD